MSDTKADASDLVMTQAELPPGIDAPSPPEERDRIAHHASTPADVERELWHLADQVGGMARLRNLVDELARTGRDRG